MNLEAIREKIGYQPFLLGAFVSGVLTEFGRMRRFRIKVVPGGRVTVGVSPYDPVRGIITFRAR